MLMTIYECNFFYVLILSLVFLSLKLYVYCLILYYIGSLILEYVANARGSWF